MTKRDLLEKITDYKAGDIFMKEMNDAVDTYTQALLQQTRVSGSLPRLGDKIWCLRKINGGKMCGRLCEGCDQLYTKAEKADYEARKKSGNDR
jgi:hypothetical protein